MKRLKEKKEKFLKVKLTVQPMKLRLNKSNVFLMILEKHSYSECFFNFTTWLGLIFSKKESMHLTNS